MTEYLFRVVLEGTIKEGYEISTTQENLAKLLKVPAGKANSLLRAKPIVIKRNVNSITAKKYKHAIEKTGACCRVEATTQSRQQVNQVGANQSNAVKGVNREAMTETETSSTESMSEKKEKSWKDSIAKKARRVAEKTSSIASDASDSISKRSSVTLDKSKNIASDFANSTAKGAKKAWESTKDTVESIAL